MKSDIDNRIDSIDLKALVNRTLKKLKVGNQSTQGKAIASFVKELQQELTRLPVPQDQLVLPEVKDEPKPVPTWESKVEAVLGGLSWNG